MKTNFKLMLLSIAAISLSMCTVEAQVSPVTSSKYTAEQIDSLYKDHKTYRPRDVQAPQNFSTKFATDFPNARDVEWEKSNSLYEVEFEIGRDDYKAYYDMQSNLVMYRGEMNESLLPAIVRNAALVKYPNYRFDGVERIVKANVTTYKVELEKGKLEIKMTLRHDGTIINEYFD